MKKYILLFLLVPILVFGQTAIYRSVQPDPNDDNSTAAIFTSGGSVTLTISGTTATFSSTAPDTVGVGNAIQYDSSNAGAVNAICFISGRTSSTVFSVQRFQGGTPASCSGDADWSVFHPYIRIDNAINGLENTAINATVRAFDAGHRNIDTANEQWNIACYRGVDSVASTSVGCDNFTTSATDYLKIYTPTSSSEVGVSQRHTGKRIRGCYQLVVHSASSRNGLVFNGTATKNIFHVRVDGLFIKVSGAGANSGIYHGDGTTGTDVRVYNCVIEGSDSVSTQTGIHVGIAFVSATGQTNSYRAYNNIIYNFKTNGATTNEGALLFTSAFGSVWCYNNTSYKCEQGFKHTTGVAIAKNCIGMRSAGDSYTGTWNAASTNCHSNAGDTPPGSNPITGTVKFAEAATNKNYHLLSTDTVAKDAGTDLRADANIAITTDIDGNSRSDATPNLGADEFPTAGKYGQTIIIGSVEKTVKIFAGLMFSALLAGLILNKKQK